MILWLRALLYMLIVGGGWLVVLPTFILYLEYGDWMPSVRSLLWIVIGSPFLVLGFLLAVWAGFMLIQRGRGTPLPLDPPQRLVITGPYRYVRNPQAIAMVLMVIGEILLIQSAWLWVLLPLTVLYLEGLVGPIETRQMMADFGDDYRDYAERVRKWIPKARGGKGNK